MLKVLDSKNKIMRLVGIDENELDLDKTFDCGQAFRWHKEDSGEWVGFIGDRLVVLGQGQFKDTGEQGLITNLTSDKELEQLENYQDLRMNYCNTVDKLELDKVDKFAYSCYMRGMGIHILRQDLFEVIVTFLMSQCNTMRNIRNIVNTLSKRYGTYSETEFMGKKYSGYSFPSLEQLKDCTVMDFEACKMGFRAGYLYNFIQKCLVDSDWLDRLRSENYEAAKLDLLGISGIGEKVANCICLFGLHHVSAFPIDTHIKRIIYDKYNGNIDIGKYGDVAGIIQQYIYYNSAFM